MDPKDPSSAEWILHRIVHGAERLGSLKFPYAMRIRPFPEYVRGLSSRSTKDSINLQLGRSHSSVEGWSWWKMETIGESWMDCTWHKCPNNGRLYDAVYLITSE
jgi:hypothetical protein